MVTIQNKSIVSENKERNFMLKCYYSRKISNEIETTWITWPIEFLFKCLSVMIYEQFIVFIVELIMLSRQPILLYNFHNMTVTWLFYHFFKLQVHVLHGLENIYF